MLLLNQLGLWAFLALIPFILIYLRRPKAIEQTIPSLMFIMKEYKVSKKHSFLRTLLRNLLFFLQLLILCALAFSVAQPYLDVPNNITSKGTVLVIDNSASSQTQINGMTRFEKSIGIAKNNLEGKISIILAGNIPRTALEGGSKREAIEILKTLRASDTSTNIGDSIIQAADILKNKGEIVVISDFAATQGIDPLVAKRKATSNGIIVNFYNVWSEADNVGITSASIGKHETKAYVKNYNSGYKIVKLNLIQNKTIMKSFEVRVSPGSKEAVKFETPSGLSRLEIEEDDDLLVDNVLYISMPQQKKVQTLLVTNILNSHLQIALESSENIDLEVIEPPTVIPDKDYDVIVTKSIDSASLLAGEMDKIKKMVKNGTVLIATSHLYLMNYMPEELLPVKIEEIQQGTEPKTAIFNQFTTDIDFKPSERHFKTSSKTNETLTMVSTADNRPLIASGPYGEGTVIYYGIFDEESDFKRSPSYPIFWEGIITTMVNKGNMNNFNKVLDEVPMMTETGFFESEAETVAVSFLNEKESDVSKEAVSLIEQNEEFMLEEIEQTLRLDFEYYLIILAIIVLIIELAIIKSRGDA